MTQSMTLLCGVLPLVMLAVGCGASTAEQGASDVRVPNPPAAAQTSDGAPRDVAGKPPAKTQLAFALPNRSGDAIGTACSDPPPGTPGAPGILEMSTCGKNGRVSVELGHANSFQSDPEGAPAPPCKLTELGSSGQYAVKACVHDDELLVSTICMVCRAPGVGSAVHARLSELTPDQSAYIWSIFGGPSSAPPSSTQGWADAIARGARR